MNVLIACEESQRVCIEFRRLGANAFSCDLEPCSGGRPEWHIQGDCLQVLVTPVSFSTMDGCTHIVSKWDLIIAHPPCTYLTNGGAVRMFRKEVKEFPPYGVFQMVNVERLKSGMLARDFFMSIFNANCNHIAVENPIPMSIYMLPRETQIIQPYMFGDPYSKKTCLWLRGLPQLIPTDILKNYHPFINGGGGRLERENYKGQNFVVDKHERSKTFPGIAKAMAEQWFAFLQGKSDEQSKGVLT